MTIADRKLKILELALVVSVAFGAPALSSIYFFFSPGALAQSSGRFTVLTGIVYELLALAVMWYVCFRQGRSRAELGIEFRIWDLPISILLAVLGYLAFVLAYLAISFIYYLINGRRLEPAPPQSFLTGMSLATVLFILLNPFYEELIVRAFVIFEVKELTGSGLIAVMVSLLIQVVYHLYQGIPAFAIGGMALVFCLYYLRYRRIDPIILAHLYFDAFALLYYSHR